MATSTSNLGLIKPAGTDHALVANINTNSDTIDTEAGKARANFALVQNGDTATAAISNGQLVVWKGVLKKATANIAIGATLSSSNLSDDTIAAELAALNSNIGNNKICAGRINTLVSADDFQPYGNIYRAIVDINVVFSQAFSNVPNVVLTENNNAAENYGACSIESAVITTTGITKLMLVRGTATAMHTNISYIAIGT